MAGNIAIFTIKSFYVSQTGSSEALANTTATVYIGTEHYTTTMQWSITDSWALIVEIYIVQS